MPWRMHPRCEMSLSNRHGAPQFALIFEDFSLVELAILREKCPNTDLFWSVLSYPVFGLNTIYSVNLHIQSEYRKIRTKNNSVFGHFSRSAIHQLSSILSVCVSCLSSEINFQLHHKQCSSI